MSDKPAHILVAEDDKSVRLVVQQALARQGYTVQSSGTAAGLWKLIEAGRGDGGLRLHARARRLRDAAHAAGRLRADRMVGPARAGHPLGDGAHRPRAAVPPARGAGTALERREDLEIGRAHV